MSFPLVDSPIEISQFRKDFSGVAGLPFYNMDERGKGLHGFRRSFSIGDTKAIFAIGGQKGRAYIELTGSSCALIPLQNWENIVELMRDKYQARITRWDGAADDFEGVHDIDWALDQLDKGGFTTGGNVPKKSCCGNWVDRVNDTDGVTLYLGKRENGKMLRVYEKGKQLGDSQSKWTRWEIEYRRRDRVIDWDVLLEPGRFVAGAYPATSWIDEERSRIKTFQKEQQNSEQHLINACSMSYGKLFNHLSKKFSDSKIVEMVKREGNMRRLDKSCPPD